MLLSEITKLISNTSLHKDGTFDAIRLGEAEGENVLTYISEEKYISKISENISCILTTKDLVDSIPSHLGIIICDNPSETFFKLHLFMAENIYKRVSVKTTFGLGCQIHKSATIAENNVSIGNNVKIGCNVVIKENVKIGDNCVINSGVVIGEDGFQYKYINGKLSHIKHLGGVMIGNEVEISANTFISNSLWFGENTIIEDNVKIDTLVHIAHNVTIKKNTLVTSGTILAGSSTIGENCFLGINSSIKNRVTVGNNCMVGMGSVVIRDIPDGVSVVGNPSRILGENSRN